MYILVGLGRPRHIMRDHAWPCMARRLSSRSVGCFFWKSMPSDYLTTSFAIYRDVAIGNCLDFWNFNCFLRNPKRQRPSIGNIRCKMQKSVFFVTSVLEMWCTAPGKLRFEAIGWIQCYTHWMIWWQMLQPPIDSTRMSTLWVRERLQTYWKIQWDRVAIIRTPRFFRKYETSLIVFFPLYFT